MPNLSYRSHDHILADWGDDLYLALLASAPGPDGTGIVEPATADGYARQPVVFAKVQSEGITSLSNANSLAYGPATDHGWVTLNYFGLFDGDGNFLVYGRLRTQRDTPSGEGVMLAPGMIQIRLR